MKPALPRWLPVANRIVVRLQKLGLPIGTMHVLAVPGRKTGALRETPVSPLTVNGKRYVIAGFEKTNWAENARAAGWAELRRGRRTDRVHMFELPVEEREPILRAFPEQVPHGTQFFDQLYGAGNDPEKFAGLADRCPVFRIEPIVEGSETEKT